MSQMRPNIIVVISDTLRADYLGCYGNKNIYTPCIDEFASQSVRFTNMYPESLPTIVYRRAFHTGRRIYPMKHYQPLKWDIVRLPGWQPMSNDEDTLAENLVSSGYYTGFVTDTLPYFAPGMNFTRGFWQWEFIRGKQQDRWRSPLINPPEELRRFGDPTLILERFMQNHQNDLVLRHAANTRHIISEEETTTARAFRWAMDFATQNRGLQPFYLLVDSFAPHEPWDAPPEYAAMYTDPEYHGNTIIHTNYGPVDGKLTPGEVRNIRAHYSGLVTLVDTWFGRFITTLKRLGLYENSLIVFTADHGTNLADNPGHIIGKPDYSMYPALMNVPCLIHFPNHEYAGQISNGLAYNVDIPATLYDASGFDLDKSSFRIDGLNLVELMHTETSGRRYLTSRYGNHIWYRDERYWLVFTIDGRLTMAFDLKEDPSCQYDHTTTLEASVPERIKRGWERVLADADGNLPDYRTLDTTDAIGQ